MQQAEAVQVAKEDMLLTMFAERYQIQPNHSWDKANRLLAHRLRDAGIDGPATPEQLMELARQSCGEGSWGWVMEWTTEEAIRSLTLSGYQITEEAS